VLWCAGVHWAYFAVVFGSIGGAVFAGLEAAARPWQLLHDYQYRRIDTFLDPTTDPLGAGYNITQAKIAWARAASRARASCRARSRA
jgi:rod shape determining protein RodA